MLFAAMMVCLGHGANDVANSISPLITALDVDNDNTEFAYMIGSIGIALGLLLLGFKVMETVGKKVVKLDYAKGFTAQFATALSIDIGSIMGIPLSTTHCMVGSLFGLILVQKLDFVKEIYPEEEENEERDADDDGIKIGRPHKASEPEDAKKAGSDNDDDFIATQ